MIKHLQYCTYVIQWKWVYIICFQSTLLFAYIIEIQLNEPFLTIQSIKHQTNSNKSDTPASWVYLFATFIRSQFHSHALSDHVRITSLEALEFYQILLVSLLPGDGTNERHKTRRTNCFHFVRMLTRLWNKRETPRFVKDVDSGARLLPMLIH